MTRSGFLVGVGTFVSVTTFTLALQPVKACIKQVPGAFSLGHEAGHCHLSGVVSFKNV